MLLLKTQVACIAKETVTVSTSGGHEELPNDEVIVCAGGVLPTGFLMDMGVTIERRFGRDKPAQVIESTSVSPRGKREARECKTMTPADLFEAA